MRKQQSNAKFKDEIFSFKLRKEDNCSVILDFYKNLNKDELKNNNEKKRDSFLRLLIVSSFCVCSPPRRREK